MHRGKNFVSFKKLREFGMWVKRCMLKVGQTAFETAPWPVRERKLNAHSINHGKVPVRRPQKDILA